MCMRRVAALLLFLTICSINIVAQQSDTPPALAELSKAQLQLLLKDIEIAQLKFDSAKSQFLQLVQSLQRQGYELDLQSFRYVKKADGVKQP